MPLVSPPGIDVAGGGGVPAARVAVLEHRAFLQEDPALPISHQHMHGPMHQPKPVDLPAGADSDHLVLYEAFGVGKDRAVFPEEHGDTG